MACAVVLVVAVLMTTVMVKAAGVVLQLRCYDLTMRMLPWTSSIPSRCGQRVVVAYGQSVILQLSTPTATGSHLLAHPLGASRSRPMVGLSLESLPHHSLWLQ